MWSSIRVIQVIIIALTCGEKKKKKKRHGGSVTRAAQNDVIMYANMTSYMGSLLVLTVQAKDVITCIFSSHQEVRDQVVHWIARLTMIQVTQL